MFVCLFAIIVIAREKGEEGQGARAHIMFQFIPFLDQLHDLIFHSDYLLLIFLILFAELQHRLLALQKLDGKVAAFFPSDSNLQIRIEQSSAKINSCYNKRGARAQ